MALHRECTSNVAACRRNAAGYSSERSARKHHRGAEASRTASQQHPTPGTLRIPGASVIRSLKRSDWLLAVDVRGQDNIGCHSSLRIVDLQTVKEETYSSSLILHAFLKAISFSRMPSFRGAKVDCLRDALEFSVCSPR